MSTEARTRFQALIEQWRGEIEVERQRLGEFWGLRVHSASLSVMNRWADDLSALLVPAAPPEQVKGYRSPAHEASVFEKLDEAAFWRENYILLRDAITKHINTYFFRGIGVDAALEEVLKVAGERLAARVNAARKA